MTTIQVSPGVPPLFAATPWQSGRYYTLGRNTPLGTAATLGNGNLGGYAFYVPNNVTLSRIGGEITSAGDAGCTLRLGIYTDSGGGRPLTLVIDAGTIAGDSVAVQEIVISQALGAGVFWAVAAVQGVTVTQPTVRTMNPISGPGDIGTALPGAGLENRVTAQVAAVTGALPATFVPTAQRDQSPIIFVKVA